MKYLIVENGKIANIIVADAAFAASAGAKDWYDGAAIGAAYDPPTIAKLQAQLAEANAAAADIAQTVADLLYQQDLNNIGG